MSWPTMMCIFCRRSTRCGSRPNGRIPTSAPASSERIPEGARRALPGSGSRRSRARRRRSRSAGPVQGIADATRPRRPSRYLNCSGSQSSSATLERISRRLGPGEVDLAQRAWVRFAVRWTSIRQSASHHEEQQLVPRRRRLEVVVTQKLCCVEPADRAVVGDPSRVGGHHLAVAHAPLREIFGEAVGGCSCRRTRRPVVRAAAACRASRRRSPRRRGGR